MSFVNKFPLSLFIVFVFLFLLNINKYLLCIDNREILTLLAAKFLLPTISGKFFEYLTLTSNKVWLLLNPYKNILHSTDKVVTTEHLKGAFEVLSNVVDQGAVDKRQRRQMSLCVAFQTQIGCPHRSFVACYYTDTSYLFQLVLSDFTQRPESCGALYNRYHRDCPQPHLI